MRRKRSKILFRKTIYTYLIFLVCLLSVGSEKELFAQMQGFAPPIYNISPIEYKSTPHIWSIAQDSEGVLYFATDLGLVRYDGSLWEQMRYEHSITRKVYIYKDIIYTSGDGFFGFWKKREAGHYIFRELYRQASNTSLANQEFWNIERAYNSIYFISGNEIHILNEQNELSKIIAPSTITKVFKVNEKLFVIDKEYGVFELRDTFLDKLKNTEKAFALDIRGIYFDGEQYIFISQTQGTSLLLTENGFVPYKKNKTVFNDIFSFASTKEYIFIGTINKGLYVLDKKQGTIIYHMNKTKGLQNNTVLAIHYDRSTGVWLGLDTGIAFIDLKNDNLPYTNLYNDIGTAYCFLSDKNKLYVGTNQGLYVRNNLESSIFKLVKGTEGQVWCIKKFRNTLLIGHNKGTLHLDKQGKVKKIGDKNGTWDMKPTNKKQVYIICGNYNGIMVLKWNGTTYELHYSSKEFYESSSRFEVEGNKVWVSSNIEGVACLEFSDNMNQAKRIVFFTHKNSNLPSGKMVVSKWDKHLVFSTEEGFYKYNDNKQSFEKTNLKIDIDDKPLKLLDFGKHAWAVSNNKIFYINKDKHQIISSIQNFGIEKTNRLENILPYENAFLVPYQYTFAVNRANNHTRTTFPAHVLKVNKIMVDNKAIVVDDTTKIVLPYDKNIQIFFAVPGTLPEQNVSYLFNNKNINSSLQWENKGIFSFVSSEEGDYEVLLQARLNNHTVSKKILISVLPPWYRMTWMYVVYFITGSIMIFYFVIKYKKSVKRLKQELVYSKTDKRRLEEKVGLLEEEKLKSKIKEQSIELTLSLKRVIEKNKNISQIRTLLFRLKESNKEIGKIDEYQKMVKFIETIDSTKSDLDKFNINLQKANQDYVDKLREKQPRLTAKDVQLCIFIYLNLSSKDIASIENISVKSIEIARYRLRKKLGLKKNESLIQYLRNI